jgi:SsrA-binding protein
MSGRRDEEERTVATNRRARYDFEILERFEAGIALTGSEVKSMRAGRVALTDCYARIRDGEVWLEGMHVAPYEQGDTRTHQPLRPRKLLLHAGEIVKLQVLTQERGFALVPLRAYFTHGIAKVELAVARGKRRHEKRQSIAKREAQREIERATGRRR